MDRPPAFTFPPQLPMPIRYPPGINIKVYKCICCGHVVRPPSYFYNDCGHRVCGHCLASVQQCPGKDEECKLPLSGGNPFQQDYATQKKFKASKIWCPRCDVEMPFAELEQHLSTSCAQ